MYFVYDVIINKVSSKAELEAPAVARWAALVGYAKRTILRRRLKVSAVGEPCIKRQIIPDCGCKVAVHCQMNRNQQLSSMLHHSSVNQSNRQNVW